MISKQKHLIFHGELSDAPGRNESWDEYVIYLGNNRWKLIVEGTDFAGFASEPPMIELMSTKTIINWVLERDAETDEDADESSEDEEESIEDEAESSEDEDLKSMSALGPRGEVLREIALSVGATYCVTCLDRWLSGSWPPKKRLRLLEVKSLTERGVWLRIYHKVFDVDTNLGPAFMYPPNAEHMAKVVLKNEGSMSSGRMVKVPKALWSKIDELWS